MFSNLDCLIFFLISLPLQVVTEVAAVVVDAAVDVVGVAMAAAVVDTVVVAVEVEAGVGESLVLSFS